MGQLNHCNTATDVTRSENEIELLGLFDEKRQVIRAMGKIGVHFEEERIVALQSPTKSL